MELTHRLRTSGSCNSLCSRSTNLTQANGISISTQTLNCPVRHKYENREPEQDQAEETEPDQDVQLWVRIKTRNIFVCLIWFLNFLSIISTIWRLLFLHYSLTWTSGTLNICIINLFHMKENCFSQKRWYILCNFV